MVLKLQVPENAGNLLTSVELLAYQEWLCSWSYLVGWLVKIIICLH
jgi:hypothetical protein